MSRDHKKWLRIRGLVKFDENRDAKAQVFEEAPHLLNIYPKGKNDETFVTFFLENAKAMIFSITGEIGDVPIL
ncbi:MAG: hypothetical protein N2513_00860 [Deltaproteobacteria bacterium]|nr:hypothetical protein [Deltaproteobacteria bacterium]